MLSLFPLICEITDDIDTYKIIKTARFESGRLQFDKNN